MPLAYDVHPEFGYFCPRPRALRRLRVALVSVLFGMVIGAGFVAIRAGRSLETGGVSSNAYLKSPGLDTLTLGVAAPGFQFESADNAQAGTAEAIKPDPMRMARARSGKVASPIAGIPLGPAAAREPDIVPSSANSATPENAEGPGSPAASPQAQSFAATARPAVSATKKRLSIKKRLSVKKRPNVVHARRHRDDENENARWQNGRAPVWGERGYGNDQNWHGAFRNWVY